MSGRSVPARAGDASAADLSPTTRPRLLVLSPRYPYPVIGGDRLRLFRICETLSRRFELTLLALCETEEEFLAPHPTDGVFSRVERVMLPRWRSYANCLLALLSRTPLQVAYYHSREFGRQVKRLAAEHDACLAHLVRTARYALECGPRPAFLEMTDAISMNYGRVGATGRRAGLRGLIYQFEQRRLLRFERMVTQRFEATFLVSEIDRDYLRVLGADVSRVLVAPNGVALMSHSRERGKLEAETRTIVFIGNLTSMQNMDAARFFAEMVMPQLRERMRVRFRIIGRIGDRDAKELRLLRDVEVTGEVERVEPYCADAFVGVCPVRIGAGIQNKILEYMALGLPVVSSSVGLEGLRASSGSDLLVADSVADQVAAICAIAQDSVLAERLSRNGRVYVERNHDWDALIAPIGEIIARLISERRLVTGSANA